MLKVILFIILSIPIVMVSWRTLFHTKSHGFYRFFAWEGMLWLLVSNYRYWFTDPLSLHQAVAWFLLVAALYLVMAGVLRFFKHGNISPDRPEKTLFSFEKTTELIDRGIYKYVRHPLYGSLIFLTWGIFFKHPETGLFFVALFSTVLLYITSRYDEKECIAYFGERYRDYMKQSKMFVPFVF
jgi:protein-S-isoprenylcysteine O-methyltransferase Ste14